MLFLWNIFIYKYKKKDNQSFLRKENMYFQEQRLRALLSNKYEISMEFGQWG